VPDGGHHRRRPARIAHHTVERCGYGQSQPGQARPSSA